MILSVRVIAYLCSVSLTWIFLRLFLAHKCQKIFFINFLWKNESYKSIYNSIVANNLTKLFNELEKSLPKIMVKSSRQAEKDLGYITSNVVNRNDKKIILRSWLIIDQFRFRCLSVRSLSHAYFQK